MADESERTRLEYSQQLADAENKMNARIAQKKAEKIPQMTKMHTNLDSAQGMAIATN